MRYILNDRYCFRGWYKLPYGILDKVKKKAVFLDRDVYMALLKCDGAHDIDRDAMSGKVRDAFDELEAAGIVRTAARGDLLKSGQMYVEYPARYRKSVQWSVTGRCNLACRHCFMSAPGGKHGNPSLEDLLNVVDQLAECGIFRVSITGGEPLIRDDLLDIIDALQAMDIGIDMIYTNGWLIDEAFLDELDRRDLNPNFQLSFDGVNCHDWLRGVPGAEARTIHALELLKDRDCRVSVAMCIHKKNCQTIRQTVNLMASLGVASMKCGKMMDLGEWQNPELQDVKLTDAEEIEIFADYIPKYFEDNAPLSIMLGGAFMYTPGDDKWEIYNEMHLSDEDADKCPSCGVLTGHFYIGADGMVAPCMGMADCGFASRFPNLKDTPLREILRDSGFVDLCYATVGDVRSHNPECGECLYKDRCAGGCRNSALMQGDDYFAVDKGLCEFFGNGWDEKIRASAEPAFREYIKRNPPGKKEDKEEDEPFC